MIKNCALIAGILSLLAGPVCADVCPSDAEVDVFKSCTGAALNAAEIQRCTNRWNLAEAWCRLGSGEYDTKREASVPVPAPPSVFPPQPAPSVVPACGPASLQNCTCGPQLTTAIAQRIDRANPGTDPLVKELALRQGLELMGCVARSKGR